MTGVTMFKNATIRARLAAMAGIPLVLILLVSGLGFSVLQSSKINSPEYKRISLSKELVADVLPPPQNLEGSLLAAYQIADGLAAGDESQVSQASVRLKRLRRDFQERHLFWTRNLSDPELKRFLLERAYAPSQRFYVAVEYSLLPAVARGNLKEVQTTVRGLVDDYNLHLKAINVVVRLATAEQKDREAAVDSAIRLRIGLLSVAVALLILGSVALGYFTVRSIVQRIRRLRQVASEDLPRAIVRIKAATLAGEKVPTMEPISFTTRDELTEAADAFNGVLGSAVAMASEQAALRRTTSAMFINLGRRNHKLLSRTLSYISELERTERDPQTLQNLFRLDHLTTRQRRNAESLLVLAGSAPLRTWSKPVDITDVLRSALSEIESYDRVDIGEMQDVSVKGGAVSDVAHLMAELLENSTNFSSPQTRVRILGRREGSHYSMVIIDEGIGMAPLEIAAANQRIATAANTDLDTSKMLGLGVVGRLAARHTITVRVAASPTGGLAVKVTLPPTIIGDGQQSEPAPSQEDTEPQILDVRQGSQDLTPRAAVGEPDSNADQPREPQAASGTGRETPTATHRRDLSGASAQDATPPAAVEPAAAPPTAEPPRPAEHRRSASADSPAFEPSQSRSTDAQPEPPAPVPPAPLPPIEVPMPAQLNRPAARDFERPIPATAADNSLEPAIAAPLDLPPDAGPMAETPVEETPGTGRLTRRVRGAQLPDTGPDIKVTAPVPTRTADSVRSALSQFSTGQRSAQRTAPGATEGAPHPGQSNNDSPQERS